MIHHQAFQVHLSVGCTRSGRLLYRARVPRCSLSEEERGGLRFRKEDEYAKPRTSFRVSSESSRILSPNERLLERVQESMERLGVADSHRDASSRKFVDISQVNPLGALSGAAGAALISFAAWTALRALVAAYVAHPMETDFYVVQRVSAIVRTAVVGLLALASGISGVTSLGLLLLSGRTLALAITRTFAANDDDKT